MGWIIQHMSEDFDVNEAGELVACSTDCWVVGKYVGGEEGFKYLPIPWDSKEEALAYAATLNS